MAVWESFEEMFDCNYGTLPCALHGFPSGQDISARAVGDDVSERHGKSMAHEEAI